MKRVVVAATMLIAVFACPSPADQLTDLCADLIAETGSETSPDLLAAEMARAMAVRGMSGSEAWGMLGAACSIARRAEPAVYCFARAAQMEPDCAMHVSNLGFVLLDQARYDDAEIALEAAYELAPNQVQVQMNLGKLRWRQGRTAEAIELLERAAEETWHPEYPYALARALYHSDQAARAEEILDANLREHPTHEPSQTLYAQISGHQWNRTARELADEALALADRAQEIVQAWAEEIDAVAAQSDTGTPGTQMAQLNIAISQTMADGLRAAMDNPNVTDELLAMQALQCYRMQIETIGKVYHGYLACMAVHDQAGATPDLQISPVGGFDFMITRCEFTEPLYQFKDAVRDAMDRAEHYDSPQAAWCAIAGPKARAYVAEMPSRIQMAVLHTARALEYSARIDSALAARFDNFYERAEPLLQMPMLKQQAVNQRETMHAFFDPDQQGTLGARWAWRDAQRTLIDLYKQHRPEIESAIHGINRCGNEGEAPVGPPTFDDFLAAFMEAQQAAGASIGYKLDFFILDVCYGTDGSVAVTIGQGLQAVVYMDAMNESFGYKLGAGYSLELPGPATGQSSGVYFRFDDVAGPGLEWAVSGSAGGVDATVSDTYWFASHF